jgi:hypothetical protein
MDGQAEAHSQRNNAERYLDQGREGFLIDPSSGLYIPKSNDLRIETKAHLKPVSNWAERFTAIAAWFAIVISVCTLIGLVFTGFIAMKQWAQMIIANENAGASLDETRKASVESNQAFIATQRAYITPSVSYTFVPTAADPNRIENLMVAPVWANSGDTPTRGFICHGSDEWRNDNSSLPVDFKFPDKWSGNDPHLSTRVTIGPKAIASNYITTIPLQVLELLADHKMKIFAYGWARYRDIFPNTRQHVTKYCFEIKINRISGSAAIGKETFSPNASACVKNNCTDEECGEK